MKNSILIQTGFVSVIYLLFASLPAVAFDADKVVSLCGSHIGCYSVVTNLKDHSENDRQLEEWIEIMTRKGIAGDRVWGAYKYIAGEDGEKFVTFLDNYAKDPEEKIEKYIDRSLIDIKSFLLQWN